MRVGINVYVILPDPDRNTDDFCRMLPIYRGYGLLAVTVGMQGGGSIYTRPLSGIRMRRETDQNGLDDEPPGKSLRRTERISDSAG